MTEIGALTNDTSIMFFYKSGGALHCSRLYHSNGPDNSYNVMLAAVTCASMSLYGLTELASAIKFGPLATVPPSNGISRLRSERQPKAGDRTTVEPCLPITVSHTVSLPLRDWC